MKPANIQDVANLAGVHKSTVSNVITGKRFVAEETRQRVLAAIEELNFRPSQVARSLAVQQTFMVGMLISDVSNPFYHRVIRRVEDIALENGYSILLFNADYDLDRSLRYIRSMAERRIDGILLMSSQMSDEIVAEALDNQMAAVVLDWEPPPAENLGVIAVDFESGIRQMVTHLLNLGHTRFAHVSGNLDLQTARVRRDLFHEILSENGINPETVPVFPGDFGVCSGRQALPVLMTASPRPTAIFAANDLTAFGVILEAQKMGLRVPGDLSVVGLDDILLAAEITPQLTTISLACEQIGEAAMRLLLDLIAGKLGAAPESRRVVIKPRLVLRESTAPPPDS